MIRSRTLLPLLVALALLSGCSDSTSTGPKALHLSQESNLVTLVPGGWTLGANGDTLVCFDVQSNVSLVNSTGSSQSTSVDWDFGTLENGIFTPTTTYYPYPGLVKGLTTVAANSSVTLTTKVTPMLSTALRNKTLACRLTVRDIDGNVVITTVSAVEGSPFIGRYQGYLFTTESSPTTLGVREGPDSADWSGISASFTTRPAFPNPSSGATSVTFSVMEAADSVTYDLYITPHRKLKRFAFQSLVAGTHEMLLDLDRLSPGLYRLAYSAYQNGKVTSGHGDIRIE